jgi:hypothetical protein
MRRAWWSAIAVIALAMPSEAQRRAIDTADVLPQLRRTEEVRAARTMIARPFAGDLQVTLVRRISGGRRELEPLTANDLAALRLTRAQAFALATRNLRDVLAPYSIGMPDASPELSGMRSVEGELLAASRLLLTDDWRTAAEALGGPLVAVVPTSSSIMFGRDTMTQVSRRKAIPAHHFLELAVGLLLGYVRNNEALSSTVFRWTGTEWQALPPMTEADQRAFQRSEEPESKGAESTQVTAPATSAPTLPLTDVVPPAKASKGSQPKSKPSKP